MKIILTGCTGFVGRAVLAQCLAHKSITSIVALSRRPLPAEIASSDPKLKVIIVKDFLTYPESVIDELAGAEGCIWAMGLPMGDRVLEIDYPNAFARAFMPTLDQDSKKFRFVYVSGMLVETDQSKNLLFGEGIRKLKGEALNKALEFESWPENTNGTWQSYGAKPAYIFSCRGLGVITGLMGKKGAITQEELAKAMLSVVLSGSETKVFENADLLSRSASL